MLRTVLGSGLVERSCKPLRRPYLGLQHHQKQHLNPLPFSLLLDFCFVRLLASVVRARDTSSTILKFCLVVIKKKKKKSDFSVLKLLSLMTFSMKINTQLFRFPKASWNSRFCCQFALSSLLSPTTGIQGRLQNRLARSGKQLTGAENMPFGRLPKPMFSERSSRKVKKQLVS